MKNSISFLAFVSLMVIFPSCGDSSTPEEPTVIPDVQEQSAVLFADSCIEDAVRELIGKSTGDIYESDISGITDFILQDSEVSDLSDLKKFTNLESLSLTDCYNVTDFSILNELTVLKELKVSGTKLDSFELLSTLTWLKGLSLNAALYIDSDGWKKIGLLANLVNLEYLDISRNYLGMTTNFANPGLEDLPQHPFDIAAEQFEPLSSLTRLKKLDIGMNYLDSNCMEFVSGLTALEVFDAGIPDYFVYGTSVPPCGDSYVGNLIDDISFLSNLTELQRVDLASNPVTDISPLLENTGIGEGDTLYLMQTPSSDATINTYIPELEARGVTVEYGDCLW